MQQLHKMLGEFRKYIQAHLSNVHYELEQLRSVLTYTVQKIRPIGNKMGSIFAWVDRSVCFLVSEGSPVQPAKQHIHVYMHTYAMPTYAHAYMYTGQADTTRKAVPYPRQDQRSYP